jgi:hypothetical protein
MALMQNANQQSAVHPENATIERENRFTARTQKHKIIDAPIYSTDIGNDQVRNCHCKDSPNAKNSHKAGWGNLSKMRVQL